MKANYEIDDWVIYGSDHCRISGYNDGRFRIGAEWLYSSDIQPIPLTPEILEKNGFDSETFLTTEWGRKVYFREFPGCVLEPSVDGEYTFGTTCYWSEVDEDGSPLDWGTMYDSRIKGLHYVHEIQHALRLCGLNDLADSIII